MQMFEAFGDYFSKPASYTAEHTLCLNFIVSTRHLPSLSFFSVNYYKESTEQVLRQINPIILKSLIVKKACPRPCSRHSSQQPCGLQSFYTIWREHNKCPSATINSHKEPTHPGHKHSYFFLLFIYFYPFFLTQIFFFFVFSIFQFSI